MAADAAPGTVRSSAWEAPLDWLFGKKASLRVHEDRVWKSSAAREAGFRREVERLRAEGHSVIAVAWTQTALGKLASDLAALAPERCVDAFSRGLIAEMGQRSGVVVALASALPDAPATARNPVDVLVMGRSNSRESDDAIAHMAHELGKKASIAFHLAFDDPLLAEQASGLGPILSALQMPDDEAITSPMVTRAIRSAQEKKR